jgi:hypothetical protein
MKPQSQPTADEDQACTICLGSGEMCTTCETTTTLCGCREPKPLQCGMCQGTGER